MRNFAALTIDYDRNRYAILKANAIAFTAAPL